MGQESSNVKRLERWLVAVFLLLAGTVLAIAISSGFAPPAFAASNQTVYRQSAGYEPYLGWQDSPWDEASDPWYSSSGGTSRKGFPAWSLADPLSKGVTGFSGGIATGSSVSVVTDSKKTNTSGLGTYDDPYYYKNIILPSYDADADTLRFTLTYVGAGGADPVYLFDGHGGLLVTKSDDPATWDDPANIVWEGDSTNVSIENTSDNWWKNIVCSVDGSKIDRDQTYYLVVKNGTAGRWARLYANIVFEFNTYTDKALAWDGDETQAGYGREQGNGGTKLGIVDPEPSSVTTDLSKLDSCWFNALSSPLNLGDDGSASVTIHADGSGSNWQSLSTWTGSCADKVNVYDSDPTGQGSFDVGSLVPVASAAAGTLGFSLANPDRDWPSYDGVNIDMSGLEGGKTYYLIFSADLQPQTTQSLGKPIVFKFTTVDKVESWNIGRETATDATATLYSDGQLMIAGTGDLAPFDIYNAPWKISGLNTMIKTVRFEGVAPTDLSDYFAGCSNLVEVSEIPDTVSNMMQTFTGCSSLKAAPVIPEGVKNLRTAFSGCSSLTAAPTIPRGVENLISTFFGCTGLKEAPLLPDEVVSLQDTFQGCTALREVPVIPASVQDMSGIFSGCTGLTAMPSIPNGVVNMREAFFGCTSLKTTVALPDTITNMGGTFNGCTALEQAPALPAHVETVTNLFNGCTSLKSAPEIPDSVTGSMFSAFGNCISMKTGPAKIPGTVTELWRCFQNCRMLKEAPQLGQGVEKMKEAFSGCSALESAPVIPDSVTTLQSAFQNCAALAEAPLVPSSVTNLTSTFQNCTSLVRLPEGFAFPNVRLTNTFKVNAPYSPDNLLATFTVSKDPSLANYDWTGSNRTLVVQDFSSLNAGIVDAEKAAAMAVSADGKDVANGSPYVGVEAMKAFADAIASAKNTAGRADAVQDEIDAAASTLAEANEALAAATKTAVTSFDELNASLSSASAVGDSVWASDDGLDVAAGKEWATRASIDHLRSVVAAQALAAANQEATQNDIDAARQTVEAAAAAFSETLNTSNPSTVALAAALSDARSAAEKPLVSTNGRDVPNGKTWCTSQDLQALDDAIDTSQAVVDAVASASRAKAAAETSQDGVDASLASLKGVLTVFNAQVRTAVVDSDALSSAVAAGDQALSTTTVSSDGSDVLVHSLWVTQNQADTYRSALVNAQAIASDGLHTQDGVDAALADLAVAASTFDNAKRPGLKVDISVLASLVDDLNAEASAVTIGSDPGKIAAGTTFVTQGALDEYREAISRAEEVLKNPDATQEEVDEALTRLVTAKAAFDAAKQIGVSDQKQDAPLPLTTNADTHAGSTGDGAALVSTGDRTPFLLIAGASVCLIALVVASRRRIRRRPCSE